MVKPVLKKKSVSAALKLGVAAGVPHLIFITDEDRVPDPFRVCEHMPAGSIIICRDYNHADRIGFARALRQITKERQQFLLVAGDEALARSVRADGLHLPSYKLASPPQLTGFGLVSAACHTRGDLRRAQQVGVDFALVSPVFPTMSHPGAPCLGVHRLARLIKGAHVPVVALGGINSRNAGQLKQHGLLGVAAINGFVPL
ncbi:MAG: thiamine phosphate synthase [Kordiimonadaceae bacterium]|nr:thiamine phosphate synthase [Kordiimonadaceae bacterium]